jgi:hypothetical protein
MTNWLAPQAIPLFVMPGLDPGISHMDVEMSQKQKWPGRSPAMTF